MDKYNQQKEGANVMNARNAIADLRAEYNAMLTASTVPL